LYDFHSQLAETLWKAVSGYQEGRKASAGVVRQAETLVFGAKVSLG
jgi:hypothetical protein